MLPLDNEEGVVAMLWRILISTLTVHVVTRRIRDRTTNCKFCLALTAEQHAQISTPSYKLKKEKHEARKAETATPTKETSELVDLSGVSVIGVVGQQETVKSPSISSAPPEKKVK